MRLMLLCLAVISLMELLLYVPFVWRLRRYITCLLIPALAIVSGLLFGTYPTVWVGLVFLLSLYRLVNLLRVLEGRLHAKYLLSASRKTSLWLITGQLLIVGIAAINKPYHINDLDWLYGLAGAQLLVSAVILSSTIRHLRTTRPPEVTQHLSDKDLPTLSVMIPARNETDDLETCLQSLVASDYPKLEILVLDDCSQNRRTPGIIRDFAQHGVRFVAGKTPPKQWLAKNYAYQQLTDEANGELLLFCGVDTRFQAGSLRVMVASLLQKEKRMISWIPRNQVPSNWDIASVLFQPSRYAWELALPRRLFKRPPTLSTCWLIQRQILKAAGSFEAVSHSVSPESYFARYCVQHGDSYSFQRSNGAVGLESWKTVSEQRATAIRTRYPQLHRRPELVFLIGAAELTVLVLPFITVLVSLHGQYWLCSAASGLAFILLTVANARLVNLTYRQFLWRSVWILPFAVVHDIAILNYSMWRYEFREVIWKGRNICVPVMQVLPRLPKLSDLPSEPAGSERRHGTSNPY